MQQAYKIYFDGEIAPNFNPDEVQKRAQAVFRLDDVKVKQLFNGSKHILKDGLSLEECETYITQLASIGLVGKYAASNDEKLQSNVISENLKTFTTSKESNNNMSNSSENKPRSKALPIVLLAAIVAGGGFYAWQEGYVNFLFDHQTAELSQAELQVNNVVSSTDSIANNTVLPNTNNNTIELCTDPEVSKLLEKVLAEGIPQLIQQSSPDINLTISDYSNNQELYFDQTRNKRLCGVLAQFSVDAPNISQNIDNPSIVYEVIYEIQKENDSAIRLSTFRQKIISSNIQTVADSQ